MPISELDVNYVSIWEIPADESKTYLKCKCFFVIFHIVWKLIVKFILIFYIKRGKNVINLTAAHLKLRTCTAFKAAALT